MKSGKAPGPDGFIIEFYKKFSHKLSPILKEVFTEIIEQKLLPQTMSHAIITVVHKKGKDPLKCDSYRPISLFSNDYKILAKILSVRLNPVMQSIIHQDQTGFIAGRQLSSNLRRLFNILYSQGSSRLPEVLLSLDAHKAFDRIEYEYLSTALKKIGFGPSFCTWISILYAHPTACIRTNRLISDYFRLYRGTRQGCPLSPLLFNIAIEPLAIALRKEADLSGINRGGSTHKISLYADDLIIYISNPDISIPRVIELINSFGGISGYQINFNKSILFPINNKARQLDLNKFPFKISYSSFEYLGISVTSTYKELFRCNFAAVMEKTKKDLNRWSLLPISLAGRINTVKYSVCFAKVFIFISKCPIVYPQIFL